MDSSRKGEDHRFKANNVAIDSIIAQANLENRNGSTFISDPESPQIGCIQRFSDGSNRNSSMLVMNQES